MSVELLCACRETIPDDRWLDSMLSLTMNGRWGWVAQKWPQRIASDGSPVIERIRNVVVRLKLSGILTHFEWVMWRELYAGWNHP